MNVKLWNEIYNTHALILDTCKENFHLGVRVHLRTYIAHAHAVHVHNHSCEIYAYMYREMTFRLPSQILPRILRRTFSTGSFSRMPIKVCGSTVLKSVLLCCDGRWVWKWAEGHQHPALHVWQCCSFGYILISDMIMFGPWSTFIQCCSSVSVWVIMEWWIWSTRWKGVGVGVFFQGWYYDICRKTSEFIFMILIFVTAILFKGMALR